MANPKYKGKRIAVTCSPTLYEVVDGLADEETRTVSQMVVVLVQEALATRGINIASADKK